VRNYLERGTEQVLVIYPEVKEIHYYRRDVDAIFKLPRWVK
jgi:hypothetical protein